MQIWFIGRTLASQAGKAGSIPVICFSQSTESIDSPVNSALSHTLNFTKKMPEIRHFFIGVTGFEPATPWSQTRCSSQAEPHPAVHFLQCKSYYILIFFPLSTAQSIFLIFAFRRCNALSVDFSSLPSTLAICV